MNPFLVLLMVLISLPIVFASDRTAGMSMLILLVIGVCFAWRKVLR